MAQIKNNIFSPQQTPIRPSQFFYLKKKKKKKKLNELLNALKHFLKR